MIVATCHPARKAQARGLCKCCYDKWLKSVNPAYKDRQIRNASTWAKRNPERAQEIQFRRRVRDRANPAAKLKQRNRWLKRYGITHDDYVRILAMQNNACALCFRKPSMTRFHVDHCHTTGKIRGILCHQCNWYLGIIDADPEILQRIKLYRESV